MLIDLLTRKYKKIKILNDVKFRIEKKIAQEFQDLFDEMVIMAKLMDYDIVRNQGHWEYYQGLQTGKITPYKTYHFKKNDVKVIEVRFVHSKSLNILERVEVYKDEKELSYYSNGILNQLTQIKVAL